MRPLPADEDPHRGGPAVQLVPPGAFAQQPGHLSDVRLLDPAPPVPAARIAAGLIGTALADLAAGTDGDLPDAGRHPGDRGPLPGAKFPADGAGELVTAPDGQLMEPSDQAVASPGAIAGGQQPPPESRRLTIPKPPPGRVSSD